MFSESESQVTYAFSSGVVRYVRFDLTQRYFVRMGSGIRPRDISGIYIADFFCWGKLFTI